MYVFFVHLLVWIINCICVYLHYNRNLASLHVSTITAILCVTHTNGILKRYL